MYEFHGWIKLAESARDIDEGGLERKCEELQSRLNKLNWPSGRAEVLLLNGLYTLTLNAIPNRRRSEATELQELLRFVASEFKGAYGLVYEHDEHTELPNGCGVFSVNVIRRGECETRLDPFLSPRIPVVEDEFE